MGVTCETYGCAAAEWAGGSSKYARGDNTVDPERKAIAIIRRSQSGVCQKMGQALYKGGIRLVEIIFNRKSPDQFSQTAQASSARSKEYKEIMKIDAGAATTPELQGPRQRIKLAHGGNSLHAHFI